MDTTPEEERLLWGLQGALTKIGARYAGEVHAFPTLDAACRAWLVYRQAQEDLDAVDALELSVRSANILQNAGVRSITALRKMKEKDLIQIGCVTEKVRKDIAEALAEWDEKHPAKTVARW